MSIKIGILSPDVDRQIELLKLYPEIAEKHYKPAFQTLVEAATGMIRPTIPVATGKAASKFRGVITGKGLKLAASIGWAAGKKQPWYINVVEYGARPHWISQGSDIRNRKSRWLKFQRSYNMGDLNEARKTAGVSGTHIKIGRSGQWRTIQTHPGIPGRGFMHRGAQRLKPLIDSVMGPANEAVAKELSVP